MHRKRINLLILHVLLMIIFYIYIQVRVSYKSLKEIKINPLALKSDLPEYLVKRRQIIKDYCNKNKYDKVLQQVNENRKWRNDLWFDYKYHFLYCTIAKVSSSSWLHVMFKLKDLNITEFYQNMRKNKVDPSKWRQKMRQKWFRIENASTIQV